jgi:hypothetical protein
MQARAIKTRGEVGSGVRSVPNVTITVGVHLNCRGEKMALKHLISLNGVRPGTRGAAATTWPPAPAPDVR